MKDSATLTPQQLARSAGISTDTLRHYERCGVLAVPERTSAGYRRYPVAAIARVAIIRRALSIGFSLKQLSQIFRERDLGGAPCRKVHAVVSGRLSQIDGEIAALHALKSELMALLRDWDARLSNTPKGSPARLLDSLASGRGRRLARNTR